MKDSLRRDQLAPAPAAFLGPILVPCSTQSHRATLGGLEQQLRRWFSTPSKGPQQKTNKQTLKSFKSGKCDKEFPMKPHSSQLYNNGFIRFKCCRSSTSEVQVFVADLGKWVPMTTASVGMFQYSNLKLPVSN
jgi:hypothetical protein